MIDHGGGIDAPARDARHAGQGLYRHLPHRCRPSDGVPSDFYSPALQPGSIRPGTVIYDTNGHVGIVYRVDAAGRIYYMDAHPDFTITAASMAPQFGQSPTALGGGLKNWRPLQLSGRAWKRRAARRPYRACPQRPDRGFFPGAVSAAPNRATAPRWPITARRWASMNMSAWRCRAGAAISIRSMNWNPPCGTLCNDLEDRAQAVDQAVANGISAPGCIRPKSRQHLSADDNDWESYATPARDARLRAAFVAVPSATWREMIGLWLDRDPRIVYDGHS